MAGRSDPLYAASSQSLTPCWKDFTSLSEEACVEAASFRASERNHSSANASQDHSLAALQKLDSYLPPKHQHFLHDSNPKRLHGHGKDNGGLPIAAPRPASPERPSSWGAVPRLSPSLASSAYSLQRTEPSNAPNYQTVWSAQAGEPRLEMARICPSAQMLEPPDHVLPGVRSESEPSANSQLERLTEAGNFSAQHGSPALQVLPTPRPAILYALPGEASHKRRRLNELATKNLLVRCSFEREDLLSCYRACTQALQ